MADEMESMMYVGTTPWHGIGVKIDSGDNQLTVEKAIVAAGLDWEVTKRRLYVEGEFESQGQGLLNHFATCRESDNTLLGVVGTSYQPLQNRDAFNWFQPFLDQETATIETAGSLLGGRKIWVMARINKEQEDVMKDDPVQSYILLSNSHDGSISINVGFTPIRVVCNNTLSMAHSDKASKLIRVRHSANMKDNLESIREVMKVATSEFSATIAQYKVLARKEINKKDLEEYVRVVLDLKEESKSKRLENIIQLFEVGLGSDRAGTTYWGAYNAIDEYLNYKCGKTTDNRLNSLWFGNSAVINKRALLFGLKMAA